MISICLEIWALHLESRTQMGFWLNLMFSMEFLGGQDFKANPYTFVRCNMFLVRSRTSYTLVSLSVLWFFSLMENEFSSRIGCVVCFLCHLFCQYPNVSTKCSATWSAWKPAYIPSKTHGSEARKWNNQNKGWNSAFHACTVKYRL